MVIVKLLNGSYDNLMGRVYRLPTFHVLQYNILIDCIVEMNKIT